MRAYSLLDTGNLTTVESFVILVGFNNVTRDALKPADRPVRLSNSCMGRAVTIFHSSQKKMEDSTVVEPPILKGTMGLSLGTADMTVLYIAMTPRTLATYDYCC